MQAWQGVVSVVAQDHGTAGLRRGGGAGVQEQQRGEVPGTVVSGKGLKACGAVIVACGRGRGTPVISTVISGVGGADRANCSA